MTRPFQMRPARFLWLLLCVLIVLVWVFSKPRPKMSCKVREASDPQTPEEQQALETAASSQDTGFGEFVLFMSSWLKSGVSLLSSDNGYALSNIALKAIEVWQSQMRKSGWTRVESELRRVADVPSLQAQFMVGVVNYMHEASELMPGHPCTRLSLYRMITLRLYRRFGGMQYLDKFWDRYPTVDVLAENVGNARLFDKFDEGVTVRVKDGLFIFDKETLGHPVGKYAFDGSVGLPKAVTARVQSAGGDVVVLVLEDGRRLEVPNPPRDDVALAWFNAVLEEGGGTAVSMDLSFDADTFEECASSLLTHVCLDGPTPNRCFCYGLLQNALVEVADEWTAPWKETALNPGMALPLGHRIVLKLCAAATPARIAALRGTVNDLPELRNFLDGLDADWQTRVSSAEECRALWKQVVTSIHLHNVTRQFAVEEWLKRNAIDPFLFFGFVRFVELCLEDNSSCCIAACKAVSETMGWKLFFGLLFAWISKEQKGSRSRVCKAFWRRHLPVLVRSGL